MTSSSSCSKQQLTASLSLSGEIYDPNSLKYGQHWTTEQVHDVFAPAEEAVQAVKAWLTSFGIHKDRIVHHDNKGWLAFDASVEEAEGLLLTEYYEHEHAESSKIRIGCDEYHIPAHLSQHIDYITPGITLTSVTKRSVKRDDVPLVSTSSKIRVHKTPVSLATVPDDFKAPRDLAPDLQYCGFNITPACYRALYNIPLGHSATPGNSLGLFEQFTYFSESDVNLFFAHYAPNVPQNTFPIPQLIDGTVYSPPAGQALNGDEANLDIDIATALVHPQTVTLYQVDDEVYSAELRPSGNLFLDALDGSYCNYSAYGETGNDPAIDPVFPDEAPGGYKGKLQCGVYKPVNVISISYGEAEADLPLKYSQRQCSEFMKFALQGHSILLSISDYGVASNPADSTAANGCLGPHSTIFNPQYPASCPWVTAVGGTQLSPGQTVHDCESALQQDAGTTGPHNISSGGGFSNYFPRAWYQKAAVESYFASHQPPYPSYSELNVDVNTTKGLYNRIGRAYPDVSANGARLPVYYNGSLEMVYGTSLAAPLFASVVNLINEERFAIGKGPIGFLNSILYAHPWMLNDIANGSSPGCGTDGFQSVPGWDPMTGLGTPDYIRMKEVFLALP